MVGEQPGDQEDKQGHPFVGPAGRVLDRALADSGFDRSTLYLTNAVKHFKHTDRGKRRIHQRPDTTEIRACRPWLDDELRVIQPRLVVLLGAVAGESMFGTGYRVGAHKGEVVDAMLGDWHGLAVGTIHPSAVLRGPTRRPGRLPTPAWSRTSSPHGTRPAGKAGSTSHTTSRLGMVLSQGLSGYRGLLMPGNRHQNAAIMRSRPELPVVVMGVTPGARTAAPVPRLRGLRSWRSGKPDPDERTVPGRPHRPTFCHGLRRGEVSIRLSARALSPAGRKGPAAAELRHDTALRDFALANFGERFRAGTLYDPDGSQPDR
jgi:uracil-DNA glycosylase family 4